MKTCISVRDVETHTQLAFVSGIELYRMLNTMTEAMFHERETPLGNGKDDNPYSIDSFKKILGYIDLRDSRKVGRLYFTFFGQKMYQNGNDAKEPEKPYYLGADGSAALNYPAMAKSLKDGSAVTTGANVKQAVGVSPQNKNELLAIAALFIAEGRRSRPSIVTHLLLCDLITDQVKYGRTGKPRSLSNTLDKANGSSNFLKTYGLTAGGDSPMSQNNAVNQFGMANTSVRTGAMVIENRYFDKTVSLVVQWVVNYFDSSKYELVACGTDVNASDASSTIAGKVETHIAEALEKAKKGMKINQWKKVRTLRTAAERAKMEGLQPLILAQINSMLNAKFEKALAGDASGFTFNAGTIEFDSDELVKVLRVV